MPQDTETETIIDYTEVSKPKSRWGILISLALTWAAMIVLFLQLSALNAEKSNPQEEIITNQLTQLKNKNAKIIEQITLNADAIGSISQSIGIVSKLQKSVNDLPNQIDVPEDKNKADKKDLVILSRSLVDIEGRINKIENIKNEKEIFDNVTYTILKLRERINLSQDYEIELDLLKRLTAADPTMQKNIKDLQNLLQNGTPALAYLRDDFKALIGRIIKANEVKKESQNEDESFWGSVSASISDQVQVTKIASDSDNATANIIKNIEIALRNGDINAAIKLSGQLKGNALKVVTSWRNQLKALHKSEIIFKKIYDRSTQLLIENSTLSHVTPASGSITYCNKSIAEIENSMMNVMDKKQKIDAQ